MVTRDYFSSFFGFKIVVREVRVSSYELAARRERVLETREPRESIQRRRLNATGEHNYPYATFNPYQNGEQREKQRDHG